jgi:hypothetical protein
VACDVVAFRQSVHRPKWNIAQEQKGVRLGRMSRSASLRAYRAELTWTDAWVFASLCGGTDEQQELTTLTELIARADGLNHAIPTTDEIVSALHRLHRHGLVVAAGHAIALTDLGRQVHANGWARRGGLFSVVDNMQRALRSPRFEHRVVTECLDLSFVDDDALARAHEAYHRGS